MPVPSSQRPSRRRPGRGSRSAQPNLRAPSRKQASRLRPLNGSPETGPTSGSLRARSSIGSRPHFSASSSSADSSANDPGASPGARIQVGVGTSSRTTRLAVWWASAPYIVRAGPGARLDELVDRRGEAQRLVFQRAQPPVGVGAEPDALRGGAAVAGEREHLTARHDDADGAVQDGRGHHRGTWWARTPLLPKPPPTCSDRTRTEAGSSENSLASSPATQWCPGWSRRPRDGRRPTAPSPRAAPSRCGVPPAWCTRRPPRRRTRRVRPPGPPSPSAAGPWPSDRVRVRVRPRRTPTSCGSSS